MGSNQQLHSPLVSLTTSKLLVNSTPGGAGTLMGAPHYGGGQQAYSHSQQISAALFYGTSSLAIMFVNKVVLSVYSFPSFSFLATSQFAVTTAILYVLKRTGKVKGG